MDKLVELGLGGGGASRSPLRGGGAPCLGQPGRGLQKVTRGSGPEIRALCKERGVPGAFGGL